jgi:UDP-glucose 4-epimerase
MAQQRDKMVVTGGAGFIGSHLAEALLNEGHEVHVVDNLSGGKREQVPHGAIFHELDVLETETLVKLFEGARVVFHEAALPRVPFSVDYPLESHRANVDGTVSVLVAAKDAKVERVVYAASGSAYGDQDVLPLREDMQAKPANPYGLQKYIGELYCFMYAKIYGLQTVSLRYFNIYGPRIDPSGPYGLAIAKFLEQRKRGEPYTVVGDGEQTRDFTHVRDAVRANILAATSKNVGNGEVLNIGAGRNVSVNTLIHILGEGPRVPLPPRIEAKHSLADNTKARELIGWVPSVSIEEGLAELKKEWGIT